MPSGLQVFNANGEITLDVNTNTTRYLGRSNTGAVNGSLVDDRITNDVTVWVIVLPPQKTTSNKYGYKQPRFTQIANGLRWDVSPYGDNEVTGTLIDLEFIYGVY